MNWFQKHKRVVIITGVILLIATACLLVYLRMQKNPKNKPINKDPKNYSREDFFQSVLKGIGVPDSPGNISILKEWAHHEGGTAAFNPLNTTRVVNKGETNYNSAGVKNYPDFVTGIQATVETLNLNYYKAIVEALRQQQPTWKRNQQIIAALNTWGTTNYANSLA